MASAEFDLIDRYFKQQSVTHASTRLGIGDDCALLTIPAGYELALTADTMVENVHFFAGTDPEALGHKLLAVNLSDLAAMGAKPLSVMLALTLPSIDQAWLTAFAKGFFTLANRYQVDLIGGDTTQGPLTLTVQALGVVPVQQAMTRSAAQVGDVICMTGLLGDAGLGLKIAQGYTCSNSKAALERLHKPEPRIHEGLFLKDIAHACIDISDGLVADLGHIVKQSRVGACLEWDRLPLSSELKNYISATGDWQMPLIAGDDYELCFTLHPSKLAQLNIAYTPIGLIDSGPGVRIHKASKLHTLSKLGYEHFS